MHIILMGICPLINEFSWSVMKMFRIVKNDNVLSSFSPGFLFHKDDVFFMDKKAQSVFHINSDMISMKDFLNVLDESSSSLLSEMLKSNKFGDVVIVNAALVHGDAVKTVLIQGSVIGRDSKGQAVFFSGYCVEVKNEFSVPRIYNAAEIGLWEWNGVSGTCSFCREYHRMLGYDWPSEKLPATFEGWKKLVHPDDIEATRFQEKLAGNPELGDKFECFIRLRHKNGEYIWTIGKGFVAQRDHLGRAVSIRGTNQNIDIVQKNYETTLKRILLDPLTDCYNREFFREFCERISKEDVYPIGFLYIDVCGLKMINDLLGHDHGDRMIKNLVNVIESVIQMSKYTVRMGGDEFLVILPECGMELIAECEKNLNKYMKFKNDTSDIPVVFSIGSSCMHGPDESLMEKVNCAERNMRAHKEASRREDNLFLKSYIETVKNMKVSYEDPRLVP